MFAFGSSEKRDGCPAELRGEHGTGHYARSIHVPAQFGRRGGRNHFDREVSLFRPA
jgi:hypothetical protein